MEPVFKIIGDKVKEQSREKEPQPAVSPAMWQYYNREMIAYEKHIKSLRTYIASPELKERFGDNEFGEKDFEVRCKLFYDELDTFTNQTFGWMDAPLIACTYYKDIPQDKKRLIAYPVSQEQESQEDLWKEAALKLFQHHNPGVEPIGNPYFKIFNGFFNDMGILKKDFILTRKQHQ
jgi:hypothetical protein